MECEVLSKTYEEVTVIPTSAAVAGEVIKYNNVLGFMLIDHTATQVTAGEEATLITKAENVKVTKNTGEVWAIGEPVYWDPTNNWFTNVVGVLDIAGFAKEAVASAVLSALIQFNGTIAFLKA